MRTWHTASDRLASTHYADSAHGMTSGTIYATSSSKQQRRLPVCTFTCLLAHGTSCMSSTVQ